MHFRKNLVKKFAHRNSVRTFGFVSAENIFTKEFLIQDTEILCHCWYQQSLRLWLPNFQIHFYICFQIHDTSVGYCVYFSTCMLCKRCSVWHTYFCSLFNWELKLPLPLESIIRFKVEPFSFHATPWVRFLKL